MAEKRSVTMPSEVTDHVGVFDRFAGWAAEVASRAPFFAACVLLILVWAPTIAFLQFDTWQLLINTATTIITFLLVALLQNSQNRNDQATQHKLNAVADGLADLMEHHAGTNSAAARKRLSKSLGELRDAVGIERYESTS